MDKVRAVSRREFMRTTALGGGAVLLIGNLGILRVVESTAGEAPASFMIVVDYSKCTGCRTCETACSAYNQKRTVNGEVLKGLGNPYFSNIRVYGYNPDVDIPSVRAMCPDSPCIEACPVEPDRKTGRKALYRDDKTSTIKNDLERCIGCGSCAEKCRVGVIIPNPDTLIQAGERIFNLEKMFNYREGFRRRDDRLPDRFFEEPLTIGKKKGAVLKRDEFNHMLDHYYQQRGWDLESTQPGTAKLKELGLDFARSV